MKTVWIDKEEFWAVPPINGADSCRGCALRYDLRCNGMDCDTDGPVIFIPATPEGWAEYIAQRLTQ
jgi:hypothetical protein